jgi:hypothetical protein
MKNNQKVRKKYDQITSESEGLKLGILTSSKMKFVGSKSKISVLKEMISASLTLEAALVLPLFLFFMLAFLYFLQIFTLQEQIQSAITKMGLSMAKAEYVLQEFPSTEDMLSFDFSIFGEELDLGLEDIVDNAASAIILKQYVKKYLDVEKLNHSCIQGGFDGLSFASSSILSEDNWIDIVVSYKVQIPVKIFILSELPVLQRVRLRSWTGYQVAAAYETKEEAATDTVFVTETGSVYHKSETCTHIKLSISTVSGIPTEQRNSNGAKYKPCEACCSGAMDPFATYFITSDGTRYHSRRECSKIKRSVIEIPLTEVGERTPCKRCAGE